MKSSVKIAVLPLGATEQHGPHLPKETDTLIVNGVVERLKVSLPATLDVEFLPTETVGYSIEHTSFDGTISASYDDLIKRWVAIAERCQNDGFDRFVFLNAHGGNSPLTTICCHEIRARLGMIAVATSWPRFIKGAGIVDPDRERFDIHGGEIETSVMLALHPGKVKMEEVKDFASLQMALEKKHTHLRAYGPHAFGWMAEDLNPQGVVGNAAAATPQRGEALLQLATSGLAELLAEIAVFNLPDPQSNSRT
ncbi:MAG: creatininase family protein [Pseudomonadota bacterium]